MRKTLLSLAVCVLAVPASSYARPQNPPPANSSSSQSQSAASNSSASAAQSGTDSVAAAARKAREQKAQPPADAAAKTPRVFDNDNIPTQGGISAVGIAPPAPAADGSTAADGSGAAGTAAAPSDGSPSAVSGSLSGKDEKGWRDLFKNLRHKQDQDQEELDIVTREAAVADVQYYANPQTALQQNLTRSDINEKTAKLDSLKKKIEDDKQAISDAEEKLRAAGGDPGWAR